MKPQRIQLRRRKGWVMPPDTVKVDRTTLFGNPFSIEDWGHDRAVELHRAWMAGKIEDQGIPASKMKSLMELREKVLAALPTLRGKNLACWCPLPDAAGAPDKCHAALLLKLANRTAGWVKRSADPTYDWRTETAAEAVRDRWEAVVWRARST